MACTTEPSQMPPLPKKSGFGGDTEDDGHDGGEDDGVDRGVPPLIYLADGLRHGSVEGHGEGHARGAEDEGRDIVGHPQHAEEHDQPAEEFGQSGAESAIDMDRSHYGHPAADLG